MIARLCIFAFVLYATVVLVEMQVNLSARRQEAEELAEKVVAQEIANKELERQLEGADREYIERVARDQLGYVYPDERVYIDVSGS